MKGATLKFPGALQFAAGALALGDESTSGNSIIYRTKVRGSTLVVTAKTVLDRAYPAGGPPTRTITGNLLEPIAAAVVE